MKIFKSKRTICLLLAMVAIIFVIPQFGFAGIGKAIAELISTAVLHIVNFLVGWLVSLLIKVFVAVAQYNEFIASAAVSKGWIIIRDVFNMFFVIALLIIAFSTVLGIQKYHYKQILVSLLIAAVLVNFSKLICGIFIDISQVLMLTFVRAFKDVAGANLIEMMGLKGLLSLKSGAATEVGAIEILGATLLALIMATISVVVIGVMVMILIFRIVWLWFLVVLSPLAFVASVFPGQTKGYASQWWRNFTKEIIIGPVLAFCLWLSFAVVQEGDISQGVNVEEHQSQEVADGSETERKISEAASPQYILNFMLGIGMLVGSLMVAETIGAAGAKYASKAKSKIEAYAKGEKGPLKGVKEGAERAGTVAKGVATGAGKTVLKTPGRLAKGGMKNWGVKREREGKAGGKFIQTMAEPIKNIETLKGNLADKFAQRQEDLRKRVSKRDEIRKSDEYNTEEERQEAIKNVGGSNILDEVMFNASEAYKSAGFSDREAISAAQVNNIQEETKRLKDQGAGEDQLKLLQDRGSKTEAQAASIMLAERGKIKDADTLKKSRNLLGGVKNLQNEFDKHVKKNLKPDLLVDGIYNGFSRGIEDFKELLSDVKSGDINFSKFIGKLNDENFDKFLEAAESDGGAMTKIFKKLDEEKFESLGNNLSRTEKGREKLNKISESMDTSELKSEKDKQKFIKGTGRIDIAHRDNNGDVDVDELKTFISNNKKLSLNNVSSEAMKDNSVVKAMLEDENIKQKDIESLEGKVKKQLLDTLGDNILPELNNDGDVGKVANKARKIYAKITNNISKAFEGSKDVVYAELSKMIDNHEITIKGDIAKNKPQDLDLETNKTLSNSLNGEQVIQIAKDNTPLAQKIVDQRKIDGNLSDIERDSEWVETGRYL